MRKRMSAVLCGGVLLFTAGGWGIELRIEALEAEAVQTWEPSQDVEYSFGAPVRQQATRPIVIEEFTATWCGPCYSVGRALDLVQAEEDVEDIILLAYHSSDGYQESFGAPRFTRYSVSGIPTYVVNGVDKQVGGWAVNQGQTGIDNSYNQIQNRLSIEQSRIQGAMPFSILIYGTLTPTDIDLDVLVSSTTGYSGPVTLYGVIVEDGIPVSASNGQTEINFTTRQNLGSWTINLTQPGTAAVQIEYFANIPNHNPVALRPVFFLQKESTNEILGASAQIDVGQLLNADGWNLYR